MITKNGVDVLLSDYTMPGRNGLEVIEALRQSHPKMPVILMSGDASAIDRDQSERLGVLTILVMELETCIGFIWVEGTNIPKDRYSVDQGRTTEKGGQRYRLPDPCGRDPRTHHYMGFHAIIKGQSSSKSSSNMVKNSFSSAENRKSDLTLIFVTLIRAPTPLTLKRQSFGGVAIGAHDPGPPVRSCFVSRVSSLGTRLSLK